MINISFLILNLQVMEGIILIGKKGGREREKLHAIEVMPLAESGGTIGNGVDICWAASPICK